MDAGCLFSRVSLRIKSKVAEPWIEHEQQGEKKDAMPSCTQADDQKLRIGINAITLLSPRTGIGNYVFALGNELLASPEVTPSFFYAKEWSLYLRKDPLPNINSVKMRVKHYVPGAYPIFRTISSGYFRRGLKNHPIDVYHEPNYLVYRFDGPVVITVHDLSWIRHPETHPKERLRAMERYFPRSLDNASAIITDCQFVKNELVEVFGVAPAKINPVLLGVSPDFASMPQAHAQPVLESYGLDFGGYFLYVGTLEPRKNIPTLLEAFSSLPPHIQKRYPLALAGMRGWLTSGIESRMRPLAERGLVKVLGYVPDPHMSALYSGARAFILPSLYEGFGLPVLEAMACGAPVIASRSSSIPEVAGDAGVLCEPMDVTAFANAMRQLAEDAPLRQNLSAAGIARAASFSWQATAKATISVYRNTLAGI